MKNRYRCTRTVQGTLALVLLWIVPPVHAQFLKLESLELVNMGGKYRIFIQCTGPAPYYEEVGDSSQSLSVFLRDTKLNLTKRRYLFENDLIDTVNLSQWKYDIARIDIQMVQPFDYRINKTETGILTFDLQPKKKRKDNSGKSALNRGNQVIALEGSAATEARAAADDSLRTSNKIVAKPPRDRRFVSLGRPNSDRLPDNLNSSARISIDVNEADIGNVLRMLARQSQVNIVASKEVTGPITVSLNNVTIKQALDMVAKAHALNYIIQGEVVLVKPRKNFQPVELETKVFRLKYLNAHNLLETISQVLSPEAISHVLNEGFSSAPASGGGGGAGAGGAGESSQRGRSSTLIVTDSPGNIQQLTALIQAVDIPTRQIMIEAKLIEISPRHEEKIGIDWSKAINAQIFEEVILPGGGREQYAADIPLTGGSISYGTLSIDRYDAVINFLNSTTNTKLVSNPRILCSDNQEAVISVGTTIPIPQITRGIGGQGDLVTFEYRDVNIELRVTPHVSDDETITLWVKPQVEEIIGEVFAGQNSAPITSKRTVETVVSLRNNETMVIGGLIRESVIETNSKVWLLGDIPLIGNLFRNKSKTKSQTDLLIFITPRLLQTNSEN